MKIGSTATDSTVSCQLRKAIPAKVAAVRVRLATVVVAVLVTTESTPPTSLASRDWISPVLVAVKKRSGRFWRWL